jgi:hypothetical protein
MNDIPIFKKDFYEVRAGKEFILKVRLDLYDIHIDCVVDCLNFKDTNAVRFRSAKFENY